MCKAPGSTGCSQLKLILSLIVSCKYIGFEYSDLDFLRYFLSNTYRIEPFLPEISAVLSLTPVSAIQIVSGRILKALK